MLPVVYGDTLSVRSWVADFRKISSRRMYEFSTNGNAGLTAQAYTDWVFIDSNTLQPAAIPIEMETAFFPEGLPAVFPPRQPFPKAPPPPEGAFHMPRMVEWKDIDRMQHVNNAVYLDYANECGAQHVSACGWSWQRMAEHGFAIFLRRVLIKYLQPALLNDQLDIDTWLYDVRRTTAMRVYIIRRSSDGALLVEMHHQGVCVDLASGAPRRFPADFSADLEGSIGS
jgi:acyl-CoA thioester hydrolase